MKNFLSAHKAVVLVLVVAAVALLPFLGLTEFTTKGEPREAVVALSMIDRGDWVLPVNNGVDIPYKPPFMHWLIALMALATGHVGEYLSRLPSALSLVAMLVGMTAFFAKRKNDAVAVATALLTLTAFEVHRAGMNCRVDMVLTACTVGALLLLYRWREGGHRGVPFWAALCMSGAVMSKGPVGMVLPCLVMGVYALLRGDKFWPTLGRYVAIGLASCLLPAVWYVAAWKEGGQHFLDLVLEENVGRMTGTMSYESHAHPWTYNLTTIITGWLPWTLFVVASLVVLPWKNYLGKLKQVGKLRWRSISSVVSRADDVQVFVWTAFVVVFLFYCLPASKRSVYLLPCYPFLAFLLAEYMVWNCRSGRQAALRFFTGLMAVVALLLTVVMVVLRSGVNVEGLFHGKHAAENLAMTDALANVPLTPFVLVLVVLPAVVGMAALWSLVKHRKEKESRRWMVLPLSVVLSIFLALDGVYQPTAMNVKSLRPMAEMIGKKYASEPLFSYLSIDMLHFFGANFYLGDRIGDFESARPESGVLIIADRDREAFFARHADYTFVGDGNTGTLANEMKQTLYFYKFSRSCTK